ncbi:hypothetical protein PVW48_06640 [Dinoroseobacter sp. PD6]|uniref:hypothetical protein n=1 Tax=Dinoroseobacter sp. PD6 TaxID=3028384 RepID=UPI00237B562C|nr:hypothetical protein [Dinoroseobacter sp. PD6]MDD9716414.1 hypothetical protein [Dinoroseobacter sp. PD6]
MRAMTSTEQAPEVRRRKVFYLPGYDPFPPRRYREMYRREGRKQAELSGYGLKVAGLPGGIAWQVDFRDGAREVVTQIEVLVWSDLVQASMTGNVLRSYAALVRTAWIYLASGALWRLTRLRKGPVLAALYPVVALLAQLLLALGAGVLCLQLVPVPWLDLLLAVGVFALVLEAGYRADRWLYAHYLMRDYAYAAGLGGAYPPELRARLSGFADRLAEAARGEVDEVLLVGHSSGAYLGVTVLAELLRAGRLESGVTVGFLSLGHVTPMVSALPQATELRGDLAVLGHQSRVFWLDVTAPGDGCAFALCDPVAVSGMARADQTGPRIISARFSETLAPETWAKLRWRFYRLHFQYLHAFDRPGDYDYFQITAGPLRLKDRFEARAPSPSVLRRRVVA